MLADITSEMICVVLSIILDDMKPANLLAAESLSSEIRVFSFVIYSSADSLTARESVRTNSINNGLMLVNLDHATGDFTRQNHFSM